MINKIRTELLFSKGQKQAKQGLLEESINSFDKALSFNPSYSGIYLHKALSLSKLKKYSDAKQTLKKAIEMNPKNSAYHLFMGVIQYDHTNYDEAFNSFETTIEICPDNYLALCYKNLILLIQGKKLKEAGNILRRYLKYANHDFQCRFLEFCETFCYQNRKNSNPIDLLNEGAVSRKSSTVQFEKIIITLRSIFYRMFYPNLTKKSAKMKYMEAFKEELSGNIDGAIMGYKKTLDMYPEFVEVSDKLLSLYLDKKDYPSFIECFEQLFIYREVATLISKYKSGDNEGDIKQKLMKHSPLIFGLAYAYYQIGDYDKSAKIFDLLSMLEHENPYIFYYLGLCYIARNASDKARLSFKKSLEKLDRKVLENRLNELLTLLGITDVR